MMGDILMSTVIFTQLRKKFPHAVLHYLLGKSGYPVAENNKYIDGFIFFDDYDLTGLVKKVRSEKYDLIIDAYSKIGTAIICLLSGAKTISFHKSYTAAFYSITVKRRFQQFSPVTTTAIEHRLQLLEPLGIPYEAVLPEIFITPKESDAAVSQLKNAGVNLTETIVMVSAFGSNIEKTYPLPFMANVIDTIANSGAKLILNHTPAQQQLKQQLIELLQNDTRTKIIEGVDIASLRSFMAVCKHSTMLIGNEGGATNISKALHIPTFAIFSPTVAKQGWTWKEDDVKFTSVHINEFITDEAKRAYENFLPGLFKQKLLHFLNDNHR